MVDPGTCFHKPNETSASGSNAPKIAASSNALCGVPIDNSCNDVGGVRWLLTNSLFQILIKPAVVVAAPFAGDTVGDPNGDPLGDPIGETVGDPGAEDAPPPMGVAI